MTAVSRRIDRLEPIFDHDGLLVWNQNNNGGMVGTPHDKMKPTAYLYPGGMATFADGLASLDRRVRLDFNGVERVGADLRILARVRREEG